VSLNVERRTANAERFHPEAPTFSLLTPGLLHLRHAAAASRPVTGQYRQDDDADGPGSNAYFRPGADSFSGPCPADGRRDEAAPRPGARPDQYNARIVVHSADGPGARKGRRAARAYQCADDDRVASDPPWCRLI
jgi:hypothetical protein